MAAAASHMCAAGPSGVSRHQGSGWLHTRCPGSGRAAAAWVRVADLRYELLLSYPMWRWLTSLAGSAEAGLVPCRRSGTGCNEEMAHALDGRPSTRSSRPDEPCGLGAAASQLGSSVANGSYCLEYGPFANGCGPIGLRCGLIGRAPCWLHCRSGAVLLGGRRWALLAGELAGRGFPGRGHCVRVDAVRLVARFAADAMATLIGNSGTPSSAERSRSLRHIQVCSRPRRALSARNPKLAV